MENLSAYADYSNVTFNIYNFSLLFGSIEDGSVVPMGKIKMSPESAKPFLEMLKANIEAYEATYGPINVFDEKAREKEKQLAASLLAKQKPKSNEVETVGDDALEIVE